MGFIGRWRARRAERRLDRADRAALMGMAPSADQEIAVERQAEAMGMAVQHEAERNRRAGLVMPGGQVTAGAATLEKPAWGDDDDDEGWF